MDFWELELQIGCAKKGHNDFSNNWKNLRPKLKLLRKSDELLLSRDKPRAGRLRRSSKPWRQTPFTCIRSQPLPRGWGDRLCQRERSSRMKSTAATRRVLCLQTKGESWRPTSVNFRKSWRKKCLMQKWLTDACREPPCSLSRDLTTVWDYGHYSAFIYSVLPLFYVFPFSNRSWMTVL